ncbi:hypothetical protein [Nocardioides speluncae]|uniref:hypothetical protein n=1 Tax=Nocardioides speluncae TaxID=2670337 RepID=UPI001473612F|nr:hypothetical protein [Nocardioides speluncae]
MNLTWMVRFGAICGVVLGLSLGVPGAVEAVTGETILTSFVIGLGAACGPPAVTAIYLGHAQAAGRFGAVAYAVNLIGLTLFAGLAFALNLVVFYLDKPVAEELLTGPTKAALGLSVLVFIVGSILFGISLIRARVLPAVPSWTYVIVFPLLAVLASLPDSVFTSAMHVVAAGCLIWLSAALWSSHEVAAPELVSTV